MSHTGLYMGVSPSPDRMKEIPLFRLDPVSENTASSSSDGSLSHAGINGNGVH